MVNTGNGNLNQIQIDLAFN